MPETKIGVYDDFLDDLAEELQIPASRYEEAERRYKAVGNRRQMIIESVPYR